MFELIAKLDPAIIIGIILLVTAMGNLVVDKCNDIYKRKIESVEYDIELTEKRTKHHRDGLVNVRRACGMEKTDG